MAGPETSVARPLKCQERDTINEPTHSVHQRTAQGGASEDLPACQCCSRVPAAKKYCETPFWFASTWAWRGCVHSMCSVSILPKIAGFLPPSEGFTEFMCLFWLLRSSNFCVFFISALQKHNYRYMCTYSCLLIFIRFTQMLRSFLLFTWSCLDCWPKGNCIKSVER